MEEQALIENVQAIVGYALGASGGAAWLSSFLSDGKGGTVWKAIMSLVNIVGGNVGKASNDASVQ